MATTNETLKIILYGEDKASGPLNGVTGALSGMFSVASGIIAAGVLQDIARQLGGLAKESVQSAIKTTAVSNTFDKLADSIGAGVVPMMDDLRSSTRNMVADSDLMQAANKFLAMGLADTQEETAKLAEIATQLGTAMGEGATESMENFALMLANQSIPRLDSFGISSGVVRERIEELMAADESLTRETAFMTAVMEQAEITMAKVGEQGESAAAMQAVWQASVENLKTAIGTALIPVFIELVSVVTPLINQYGPALVETIEGLADKLLVIGEAVRGVVGGDTLTAIRELGNAFGLDEEQTASLQLFFLRLRNEWIPDLIEFGQTAKEWIGERFNEALTSVSEWWNEHGPAIIEAWGTVNTLASELGEWIADHQEEITGFIEGVAAAMVTAGIVKKVVAVIGVIAKVPAVIAALSNPVTLIIAAIALLAAAWFKNWGGIQEKTAVAVDWIKNAIGVAWDWISDKWEAASVFVSGVTSALLDKLTAWWDEHGQSVKTIVNAWWSFVVGVYETGKAAVMGIWNALVDAATWVWDHFGTAITKLTSGWWSAVKTLFEDFGEILGNIIDAIAAALTGDWETFGREMRNVVDQMWQNIKNAFVTWGVAIWDTIGLIVDEVKAIWEGIDWAAVGSNIIDGIVRGITAGIQWVRDAAGNAAQAALDAAKGLLGIESPSKAMAEIGKYFDEGLALGINTNLDPVEQAASTAGTTAMTSVVNNYTVNGVPIRNEGDMMESLRLVGMMA